MSTTFAVLNKDGETIRIAYHQGIENGQTKVFWLNDLAEMLPDDTQVIAIDNDNQSIKTIGDLKKINLQVEYIHSFGEALQEVYNGKKAQSELWEGSDYIAIFEGFVQRFFSDGTSEIYQIYSEHINSKWIIV